MRRSHANSAAPQLWVEEGETRIAPLITVALIAPIDKLYTFTADQEVAAKVQVGQRVTVPVGRRSRPMPAIVVAVEQGPWTSTLKSIAEITDPAGQLSDHLLELGKWISRYYCCPLGRTLAAMLPEAARKQSGFVTTRKVTLIVTSEQLADARVGPGQRRLIEQLQLAGGSADAAELLEKAGATRPTLKALIDKGWATESVERHAPQEQASDHVVVDPDFELNIHQNSAIERIDAAFRAGEFRALVLFGVSGSGKTEVYVQAMRNALAAGKQAIMLVPEIALTTQLVQRLSARFSNVAVIHSRMSDPQRSLAWESIATGRNRVVIGTRSAVFAPCDNLGLIVVDEEQETSYKNLQSPRFHVRDTAIMRAHMLNIPIVLGSATPSLETWLNYQKLPGYERIDLPQRVANRPLPPVEIVDMHGEFNADATPAILSRALLEELKQTLDDSGQAVLLLNRRGYATWLECASCGMRVVCRNCRASLVLHQTKNAAVCHLCHTRVPLPKICPDPSCGGRILQKGCGTERLEEDLKARFPQARIQRADSDTMRHSREYESLISDFECQKIDILVGTQMVAKGLDFPNVRLVGVIGAEPVGAMADFRAGERLFQLVTQVAGRAGRADAPGRVIVQSLTPELPALEFASRHEYAGFAEVELDRRRVLNLPPVTRFARLVIEGKRESQVMSEAEGLVERLQAVIERDRIAGAEVLGPNPCALRRVREQYRHEVLIRTRSASRLTQTLDTARRDELFKVKHASLMIDVDPVSLT